jgi:hypothetical protein
MVYVYSPLHGHLFTTRGHLLGAILSQTVFSSHAVQCPQEINRNRAGSIGIVHSLLSIYKRMQLSAEKVTSKYFKTHKYIRTYSFILEVHGYVISRQQFLSFSSFHFHKNHIVHCSVLIIFMTEIKKVNQRTTKFPCHPIVGMNSFRVEGIFPATPGTNLWICREFFL